MFGRICYLIEHYEIMNLGAEFQSDANMPGLAIICENENEISFP